MKNLRFTLIAAVALATIAFTQPATAAPPPDHATQFNAPDSSFSSIVAPSAHTTQFAAFDYVVSDRPGETTSAPVKHTDGLSQLIKLVIGSGVLLGMAAATTSIDTPERSGAIFQGLDVKASTKLYAGTLAAINASGNVLSAADAASIKVLGRVEPNPDGVSGDYDNSSGAAGDVKVTVKRGTFAFNNSGTNAITKAHIGGIAYVEDNQTVASAGGTNSIKAGIILGIDASGKVWINTALASAI